jgi:phosphoglycolate phosphatase
LTDLSTPQYRDIVLRAIIFDLDGTLLDTLADIAGGINTALRERGMATHPVESYRRMVGSGLQVLVERATGSDDSELVSGIASRVREIFASDPIGRTRPYPGIIELLTDLADTGVPTAVLSNKPHALTVQIIDGVLGDHRFASVLGQRDTVLPKPDPSSALESARAMGVDPSSVLFLGDSDVDMITATRAGMYAVGVAWGFRSVPELVDAGARAIVSHPDEVRRLIGVPMEV